MDSEDETEVDDYDDSERNHDIALAVYQRVSCFTHTLQLVVHTYDNDVSSYFKIALSKAKKLVKNLPNRQKQQKSSFKNVGKNLLVLVLLDGAQLF